MLCFQTLKNDVMKQVEIQEENLKDLSTKHASEKSELEAELSHMRRLMQEKQATIDVLTEEKKSVVVWCHSTL